MANSRDFETGFTVGMLMGHKKANMATLNVTENGAYKPGEDSKIDGWNEVNVNVPAKQTDEDVIKHIVENGTVLITNDIGNDMTLMIVAYIQEPSTPVDISSIFYVTGTPDIAYTYGDEYKKTGVNYVIDHTVTNVRQNISPYGLKYILFFTVIKQGDKYMFAFCEDRNKYAVVDKQYTDRAYEFHLGKYCPSIYYYQVTCENITVTCNVSELTADNVYLAEYNVSDYVDGSATNKRVIKYLSQFTLRNVTFTVEYDMQWYKPVYNQKDIIVDGNYMGKEQTLIGFKAEKKDHISGNLSGKYPSLLMHTNVSTPFYYVNSELNDTLKLTEWINQYVVTLEHFFGSDEFVLPDRIVDPTTMLVE